MEEKLKSMLFKTHQEYADVKYSVYRTALKLCRLQKVLKLYKIEVSKALSLLSQPLEGLTSSDPDQSFPSINIHGLETVTTKIFAQSQTDRGNEDIFPDILGKLTSALIHHSYRKNGDPGISVQAVRTFFIVMCRRELISKYKSLFWCHCEPGNKTLAKQDVAKLFSNLIELTRVIHEQSHFGNIDGAVESCFSQIHGYGITEFEFVRWMLLEPQSIVWLPTMHRFSTSESCTHNVACAICKTRPITGMRFRCLRCLDYNLCQRCFLVNTNHRKSHKSTHPIQEYVRPVTRSDSIRDMARTLRNIVTKRYKSKTISRSYLPIEQSQHGQRTMMAVDVVEYVEGTRPIILCVKETWQEQTLEMSTVSVQSRNVPYQQSLNMSRMSAGFADISQLADEEKEQLDLLIERLDEERRRVASTTQLLSSVQEPKAIQSRPSSEQQAPKEQERARLKSELQNVRDYNRELEKELEELRSSLHSDACSQASTPYSDAAPLTGHTERSRSSPTNHVSQATNPKQINDKRLFDEPYNAHFAKLGSGRDEPRLESLKNDEIPGFSPRVRSRSHEVSAKPRLVPVKAHRQVYTQSSASVPLADGEYPVHTHSVRSLGNSPLPADQHVEVGRKGPWVSRQLLPDAPSIKRTKEPPQYNGVSPSSSTVSKKSQSSKRKDSPKIFDGASPEAMLQSLSSLSAHNDSASKRDQNHRSSSRDGSAKHRISPSLQQAYQRHLGATGKAGGSEKSWNSHSQRSSLSRKVCKHNSKEYDSDSLSESNISTPKFGAQSCKSSRDQPLIDLASSTNISSDSLGSHHDKFKPIVMEATPLVMEARNLSRESSTPPSRTKSRSSIPKITKHRSSVKEPVDLLGSWNSEALSKRSGSPLSVSSGVHPKPCHSRSRTSTPKVIDTSNTRGTPRGTTPTYKSKSRSSTPNISAPRNIHPNLIDSFSSGITSRSRCSTPGIADTLNQASLTRRDTHGSFVPPRRVFSQEKLDLHDPDIKSTDSLDSVHTASSNNSAGFGREYSSDKGNTQKLNRKYPLEFDPYSSLYTSDPDVLSKSRQSPRSHQGRKDQVSENTQEKATPTLGSYDRSSVSHKSHEKSSEITTNRSAYHTSSSTLGSCGHSSMSDKRHEKSLESMHGNRHMSHTSSSALDSHDCSSDMGHKMSEKSENIPTKAPRPRKPRRNPSKQNLHQASKSDPNYARQSKRNSSANSSRRTSPKVQKKSKSISSSDTESNSKVLEENQGNAKLGDVHTTSGSRSTPEGNIESEFLRKENDTRFESPEEEMKYLVDKLQHLMPSMFDENISPDQSSPSRNAHPMSEVLLAAEQTRKAIELFTEYAVAASTGEA